MPARRVLAPVFIAFILAAADTALLARGNTISTVVVDDHRITINVPIEVVGGDAVTVARWQRGINRVWNAGNNGGPFEICGRRVVFNAQFTLKPSEHALSRTAHVVIVDEVQPGQSYISRVWHALGTSPTYSVRTGFWGDDTNAAIAAHEFGHLLGLFDEYVENANGLRAPGERPVPDEARFPDAWLSLMAQEHGSVLERHVREIIRIHGAGHVLSCR